MVQGPVGHLQSCCSHAGRLRATAWALPDSSGSRISTYSSSNQWYTTAMAQKTSRKAWGGRLPPPYSRGTLVRASPSYQTSQKPHPVLRLVLQLFQLVAKHHLLLLLHTRQLSHHPGQRLHWLGRSWFCQWRRWVLAPLWKRCTRQQRLQLHTFLFALFLTGQLFICPACSPMSHLRSQHIFYRGGMTR